MMIYYGTVCRGAPIRNGGELVAYDWSSRTAVARIPIFPENPAIDHDPNPRGNTRGCRGIIQHGEHVIALDYHTVRIYDSNLAHVRSITHDHFVSLHEVALDGNTLWIASTRVDAACAIDLDTGESRDAFWPREMPGLAASLGLIPGDIDKSRDNRLLHLGKVRVAQKPSHLHLNAVAVREGVVYALFNQFGAIANLSEDRVIAHSEDIVGGHNLLFDEEGRLLVNQTTRQLVRVYDPVDGTLLDTIDLMTSPEIRRFQRRSMRSHRRRVLASRLGLGSRVIAKPLFLRGLARSGNRLLVGMSPAAIAEVDLDTGRVIGFEQLSTDLNDCIHGLAFAS